MARMYCLYCQEEHEHYEWKNRSNWDMPDGSTKDGWVCGKHVKVRGKVEWTTDEVKEQRKEYFNSTLQPYREGVLSSEYLEAHGTKAINPTAKDIKKAKPVWKDLDGWSNRSKSK